MRQWWLLVVLCILVEGGSGCAWQWWVHGNGVSVIGSSGGVCQLWVAVVLCVSVIGGSGGVCVSDGWKWFSLIRWLIGSVPCEIEHCWCGRTCWNVCIVWLDVCYFSAISDMLRVQFLLHQLWFNALMKNEYLKNSPIVPHVHEQLELRKQAFITYILNITVMIWNLRKLTFFPLISPKVLKR